MSMQRVRTLLNGVSQVHAAPIVAGLQSLRTFAAALAKSSEYVHLKA